MMKATQEFDWARVGRLLFIVVSAGFALVAFDRIAGLMGHMIMAVLDSVFAARLTPGAPCVTWAIAGALIGAGPALWSFGPLRKYRGLVFWAPLAAVVTVAVVSSFFY